MWQQHGVEAVTWCDLKWRTLPTNKVHCAAGGLELRLSRAAGTRRGGEALPHAGAGRQDQHEHQLRLERAAHVLRGRPGVLRALEPGKGRIGFSVCDVDCVSCFKAVNATRALSLLGQGCPANSLPCPLCTDRLVY